MTKNNTTEKKTTPDTLLISGARVTKLFGVNADDGDESLLKSL